MVLTSLNFDRSPGKKSKNIKPSWREKIVCTCIPLELFGHRTNSARSHKVIIVLAILDTFGFLFTLFVRLRLLAITFLCVCYSTMGVVYTNSIFWTTSVVVFWKSLPYYFFLNRSHAIFTWFVIGGHLLRELGVYRQCMSLRCLRTMRHMRRDWLNYKGIYKKRGS